MKITDIENHEGFVRDVRLLFEHKPYCSNEEFAEHVRELGIDYSVDDIWDFLMEWSFNAADLIEVYLVLMNGSCRYVTVPE